MIKVIYNKVCGRCVQSEPLTSGMVGQPIHFEYSHDFDGLAATAVFTDGKNTVNVVNPGNECIIPHEVLTTVGTIVKVGIYAVKGDKLVIPTIYAHIGVVLKGADPNGGISEDPTLPVWAQTQAMIGNLNALETQAKDNLVLAINEVKQTADSKQDIISDIEAIRTGAAKGATALQSVPNSYRTAASQDVIDNGLSDRVSAIEGKEAGWNGKYSKPTDGIPKTDLESSVQTSLDKAETALQSVPSTYRTASEQDTIDSGKVDKVTGKGLSTNDYTDADKAKVDAIEPVTEQTVSGWGFTKNTGTYSKPTGGIPKADLASDVQASLGKAETALQEHQSLAAYRTAAEQNIIDNTKQDKLIAGENITIAADGKTISATGGGGVQSDWNQNDSTAADYVKNRPFYTGNPVETVLVAESTVSFYNFSGGLHRGILSQEIPVIVGETYKVYWDSTAYECVCAVADGVPALGNLSIMGFGPDTGEPFLVGIVLGERTEIYTTDTSASHTISIRGLVPGIVKIDKKYLPFDIPTKTSELTNDSGFVAASELADKQDKLIAGENVTIAADGKTISATGGGTVPKPLTYDYMPEGYPSKSGFDIEWDGNTDGLTSAIYNSNIRFYKVSDIVPTNDDLSGGTFNISDGDEVIHITSDMIITQFEDLRMVSEYIIIVQKENATLGDALFPQTGTYFYKGMTTGNYITRLSKQTITPMSVEFIPTMNVSAFTNDAGYLTLATLPKYEGVVE